MIGEKSQLASQSQTFILEIPAIMCDGCVGAVKRLLSPYAFNKNPDQNLNVDLDTKTASITVETSTKLQTLLDVLIKAGKGKELTGRLQEEMDPPKVLTFAYKPEAKDKSKAKAPQRKSTTRSQPAAVDRKALPASGANKKKRKRA